MTRASAGAATLAPMAAMRPSRMTMVPLAMTGPLTGTSFAFVIAYVDGTFRCAMSGGAVTATAATTAARRSKTCMGGYLLGRPARCVCARASGKGDDTAMLLEYPTAGKLEALAKVRAGKALRE